MHASVCFLDTGDSTNLCRLEMLLQVWAIPIKRRNLPSLRAAREQPHALNTFIHLHLRLGDLQMQVWFGVAPHFAVNVLPSMSFNDRFVREIFQSEQKIAPWHSHPLAVLARRRSPVAATSALFSSALSNNTNCKPVQNEFKTNPVRTARHLVMPPSAAARVLMTSTTSRLLLIQPLFQNLSRQTTLAVRGIMNDPPPLPFYITINSFSDRPRHLPKHMVIAHTEPPPQTIHHRWRTASPPAAIETSNVHMFRTPSTETRAFDLDEVVGAGHYKASVDRTTQIGQRADVQDEDTNAMRMAGVKNSA